MQKMLPLNTQSIFSVHDFQTQIISSPKLQQRTSYNLAENQMLNETMDPNISAQMVNLMQNDFALAEQQESQTREQSPCHIIIL